MEQFLIQLVENTQGTVSYLLVFGILFACGLGVPLPEDVSLILGGFLAYEKRAELIPMMAIAFLGIIIGDSMIYFLGRQVGNNMKQKPGGLIGRIVTPSKRARVESLFHKHGEKIVMAARFMPGVRAVAFFTAGSVHMKYLKFLMFDGLAALVSAPAFVYAGYYFGEDLHSLIHNVKRGQVGVLFVLGGLVLAYLLFKYLTRPKPTVVEPRPSAPAPKTQSQTEP